MKKSMIKIINIVALILFVWLVLNAFRLPEAILGFLFVGSIPGTSLSLPPTFMLIFHVTMITLIFFELLSRRFNTLKAVKRLIRESVIRQYRTATRSMRRI